MICASNSNNVLTDFISTGIYDRNRKFHLTMSPSMDILISSNLERLLYFTAGTEETRECMKKLSECGRYEVSEKVKAAIKENFIGYCADEEETAKALRAYYNNEGYLADTHTSVALACADKYLTDSKDTKKMVVVSTASPYKFAADVYKSITGEDAADGTGALDQLEKLSGMEISYPLKDLDKRAINFTTVVDADKMLEEVYKFM
jgi:threonine synthase